MRTSRKGGFPERVLGRIAFHPDKGVGPHSRCIFTRTRGRGPLAKPSAIIGSPAEPSTFWFTIPKEMLTNEKLGILFYTHFRDGIPRIFFRIRFCNEHVVHAQPTTASHNDKHIEPPRDAHMHSLSYPPFRNHYAINPSITISRNDYASFPQSSQKQIFRDNLMR